MFYTVLIFIPLCNILKNVCVWVSVVGCLQYTLLGQAVMVWRIGIHNSDIQRHTNSARVKWLDRQKVTSDFWTFVNSTRIYHSVGYWVAICIKYFNSFLSHVAIGRRWFPFPYPSALHQLTLPDHGASASRGVPVYAPAFAGTHCAYPQKDGQAELICILLKFRHVCTFVARVRANVASVEILIL